MKVSRALAVEDEQYNRLVLGHTFGQLGYTVDWAADGKTAITMALEGHYDLIVVGSRGIGQVAEFLIGSNSTRVVQHSEVPVLVVP